MRCRLVFHCLLELCRCQARGIVEHAVLLGAPVGVTPQRWRMARTVVAGRLVNGYSNQDWVREAQHRPVPQCEMRTMWHMQDGWKRACLCTLHKWLLTSMAGRQCICNSCACGSLASPSLRQEQGSIQDRALA